MNAITKTVSTAPMRPVLMPQNFDQLLRFSELAAATDMVPKDFRGKPGNIMLAVQMGSELGLSPMQSINSIAVINGRPGIWGDGLIGICRQSPLCQDIVETFEGEGDARTAVCVATRRGSTPTTARFSVADAKRAGLWGKAIWAQYPDRMLQNRARGFALRDSFPDLLRGLKTVEELRDTPPDNFRGTTLDARPEPTDALADIAAERATPPKAQPKKGQTTSEWLNEMELRFASTVSMQELDAILTEPKSKYMAGWMSNGAMDRWKEMLANTVERLNDVPHDPETGEIEDVGEGAV